METIIALTGVSAAIIYVIQQIHQLIETKKNEKNKEDEGISQSSDPKLEHIYESESEIIYESESEIKELILSKNSFEEDYFIVTQPMQEHLAILQITIISGEKLSFSNFKAKGNALYKKTHPDKGGSQEDFCQIDHAIKSVLAILAMAPPDSALTKRLNKLAKDMAKTRNKVENFGAELAEKEKKIVNVGKKITLLEKEVQRLKEIAKEIKESQNGLLVDSQQVEHQSEQLKEPLSKESQKEPESSDDDKEDIHVRQSFFK